MPARRWAASSLRWDHSARPVTIRQVVWVRYFGGGCVPRAARRAMFASIWKATALCPAILGGETFHANRERAAVVPGSKIRTNPMSLILTHSPLNLRAMKGDWPGAN